MIVHDIIENTILIHNGITATAYITEHSVGTFQFLPYGSEGMFMFAYINSLLAERVLLTKYLLTVIGKIVWSYLSVCSSWQSGKPRSIIATAIVLSSRIHDRQAFSLGEYAIDSYILLLIFLCTF